MWTSVKPYFSVDVYMPDDDVALEFAGPSHFIHVSAGGANGGGAPGEASLASTKTTHAELRDRFIAKRHRAGGIIG